VPALDHAAVRGGLGALDGLALAFAAFVAASLGMLGLFDRAALGPMVLGVLAPACGLVVLGRGRRHRGMLLATLVANVALLVCAPFWVDSMRDDAGWFAAWLVLVAVVMPLANVWLAATRWRALRGGEGGAS
jgi:hypothetical protein